MTDVDGPVPVLRFSSLLIRGAETADLADTDEQAVNVNCNMAQALWLRRSKSQEKPDSASKPASRPACGSHRKVPSNAFQIAAPGPTRWPDRLLEYGTAAGSPQAPRGCPGATRDRPDSRLGYPDQG